MSGSRLAVHLMAEHMDYAYIVELKPRSIKIVNPDLERCRRAYEAAPNALFVLRDHPLSEEHGFMMQFPERAGREHAESYERNVPVWAPMIPRNQIVVTGINEPHVWAEVVASSMAFVRQADPERRAGMDAMRARDAGGMGVAAVTIPTGLTATVRYYVAFCDRCRELGLTAGALNLSVGWPADMGYRDSPVNWAPYEPVREAIVRGGHYLVLHEYWDPLTGPADMWRWWAGRYEQCNWQVPIIIGECGGDRYVRDGGTPLESRGWAAHISQEAYMAQLAWYDAKLRSDPRIHSAQVFTWDFAPPWGTFDVRPIASRMVEYANSIPDTPPPPAPVVDELADALRAEFGAQYHDLRATLPQHATLRFDARTKEQITRIVLHHTVTPDDTSWQVIAADHVSRDWAGIGYSIGVIPDGSVQYLGEVLTARAHAVWANINGVGFVARGNYETEQPTAQMLASIERVAKVLRAWAGRDLPMIGHQEVPAATACPGKFLMAWLHPQVTPDSVSEAIRNAAWNHLYPAGGIAYVPGNAFPTYAKREGLSLPTTGEFDLSVNGVNYRGQGFAGGIAYAVVGDWGNVKCVEWL